MKYLSLKYSEFILAFQWQFTEMYFIAGSQQKCPAVKKILPADKI